MRTLCYLGSPVSGMEDMLRELDIHLAPVSLSRVFSLTQLVKDRQILEADYVLLDLDEAPFSAGHILSAAQSLCRYGSGKLLVVGTEATEQKTVFDALQSALQLGTLFHKGKHFLQRLREYLCAGEEPLHYAYGVMEAAAAREPEPMAAWRPDQPLTIAVAGALPRCGVTTQTLAFCRYLASVGLRAAVLDPSAQLLQLLTAFYDGWDHDGFTEIDGIHFCTEKTAQHDVYVMDLGCLTSERMAAFIAADLHVLVLGVKPWELPSGLQRMKELRQLSLVKIASFTGQKQLEELMDILGPIYAASYRPDPWAPVTENVYQQVLQPWLSSLAQQKQQEEQEHEE